MVIYLNRVSIKFFFHLIFKVRIDPTTRGRSHSETEDNPRSTVDRKGMGGLL